MPGPYSLEPFNPALLRFRYLRSSETLLDTRYHGKPGVGMSADAAGTSACATLKWNGYWLTHLGLEIFRRGWPGFADLSPCVSATQWFE
jgi:hypothetical protein